MDSTFQDLMWIMCRVILPLILFLFTTGEWY